MYFENLLSEFEKKFKNHGSFPLFSGESINDIVDKFNVPPQPGVYVIYGCTSEREEIIYIGRSGSMNQDGSFRNQSLKKRLTMKQGGVYRKEFF